MLTPTARACSRRGWSTAEAVRFLHNEGRLSVTETARALGISPYVTAEHVAESLQPPQPCPEN